jgi:hypothetical protein
MLPIAALFLAGSLWAQTELKPPCDYPDHLLRKPDGKIALLDSDEMKARATYKEDIAGPIKQLDIKWTAIVDVLVSTDGHVVCTKSLTGHPIIRKSVEDALRQWKFSAARIDGRKVAYLGRMVFRLCQTSCGESGPSMTIVK